MGVQSDVAQVPSRAVGDLRLLDVNTVLKSRSPSPDGLRYQARYH
jgi:hypothetical protein